MSKKTALYPGSFDPITLGHLDIVHRACRVVDKLVIAIGVHHGKKPFFTTEERFTLVHDVVAPIAGETGTEFEVVAFDDLVIETAVRTGSTMMIRGLRDGTDFDYEMQMAGMNETLAPDVQTVYLPSSGAVRHIAASLVRQVAIMGGDISPFVPKAVKDAFDKKLTS
ncbi:Phosphopantetheine adenylyltransferase [Cohaesibacter sp. ES.047]|uniref:pantetheine-phosphate adenylyltransferase n=1 Tax=Cohaesibacter sp. ES.047 TaxID=1798205 RepID=UPI000BB981C2|nr:pantetheine-phosphate adenylyltransferase [Cohaesibacter sp. ES.047]SNY93310.1 Phosphopantetheine adenylyltransferase [Cohaesibacter sp. ES.047]